MGLEHRPYVGTWRLGSQSLVQHTPDALVYLNGDVSVPGCPKCNGRIDIQQFLTEVSVDSGTQMNSASASFTLSIPLHHTDSIARDAKFIFRPGLEVHIYERGYFPVKGLYANFVEPPATQNATETGPAASALATTSPVPEPPKKPTKKQNKDFEALVAKLLQNAVRGGEDALERMLRSKVTFAEGLAHGKRSGPPSAVVIHETGGMSEVGGASPGNLLRLLQAKGLSVNYVATTAGGIELYGNDVKTYHTGAGSSTNNRAVGIETLHGGGGKSGTVIRDDKGGVKNWYYYDHYQPPPASQCETVWALAYKASGGKVSFPAVQGGSYNLKPGTTPNANGIQSHQSIGGHTDGFFEVLYMVYRWQGKSSDDAWAKAVSALQQAATLHQMSIPIGTVPENGNPPTGISPTKWEPDAYINDITVATLIRYENWKALKAKVTGFHPPVYEDVLDAKGKKTGKKRKVKEWCIEGINCTGTDAAVDPDPDGDPGEGAGLEPGDMGEFEFPEPDVVPDEVIGDLSGSEIENLLAYPYYQVFHGVVTSVSHAWSAGVNMVTVQCQSMLHFWQYQSISANASYLGTRPENSGLQTSLQGHNFTGWHPYQIMYTLHYQMVGAAGGIAWALSEKVNQDAKSDVTGETMFSLQLRYWQQRFSTSMIQLRMHGASGSLFSAAQAAFLATTGTAELTTALQNKFTDTLSTGNPGLGILEQARSVGLFRKRKNDALVSQITPGTQGKDSPSFEINMVEMQAFASNLGNMGQVNLFESTYATKANVADVVCGLTGFEFYQDVDGDFVFKPPMYNLDTSASRVYRIEDIDIISINFDEKEPEATYLTGKNAFLKNFEGTGIEGEWGHRAQYIDFRLVAQFGWRPGPDFETSYLNDPKAMFFAAANRLDVLNAPCNSATVSIPLRPELRPGYPVYIAYLDAFYYCQSFQHSYSNGGQCTTNLQLTAKRAKFYAPGTRGAGAKQGIDSIDLARPELPERPLTVSDSMGMPRLAGFPNVVMALDPKGTNPMFHVVGSDTDKIKNPNTLKNLLTTGVELGLVHRDPESGLYSMTIPTGTPGFTGTATTEKVYFYLQGEAGTGDRPVVVKDRTASVGGPLLGSEQDPIDVQAVSASLKTQKEQGIALTGDEAAVAKLTADVAALEQKIEAEKAAKNAVKPGPEGDKLKQASDKLILDYTKQLYGYENKDIFTSMFAPVTLHGAFLYVIRDKFRAELNNGQGDPKTLRVKVALLEAGLKKKLEAAQARVDAAKTSYDKILAADTQTGVDHLKYLIKQVGAKVKAQNPYYTDINSTINLLDLLSDKKASYMAGQQPGIYRYYSASHPDVSQQGQDHITYTSAGVVTTTSTLPRLTKVNGFYPRGNFQPENAIAPEAQMGEIDVKQGIKVMTANPNEPEGEVLPTNEIWELTFTTQTAITTRTVQDNAQPTVSADWTPAVKKNLIARFNLTEEPKVSTDPAVLGPLTVKGIYEERVWNKLCVDLKTAAAQAMEALKAESPTQTPPPFVVPVFPATFQPIDSDTFLKVDVALKKYLFADNPATTDDKDETGRLEWSENGKTQAMGDAVNGAGTSIGMQFFVAAQKERQLWTVKLGETYGATAGLAGDSAKVLVNKAMGVFNNHLTIRWGVGAAGEVSRQTTGTYESRDMLFSPVFPVSDAKGYHVVGSQRYGRGIDIETGNVFFGMHAQDPLSLLDREIVEEILNFFVRGNTAITVNVPEYDANGQQKKGPDGNPLYSTVSGSPAVIESALNRKAAGSLRRNLTDAQIINLFGEGSSNPTTLDNFLRNFITNKGKDGIQKIPAINAAKSLADLTLHTDRRVCSCKSAETEVMLEGLANKAFLSTLALGAVVPKELVSQRPDNISQWVAAVSALSAETWKQSQDTLRGLGNSPKK